MKGRIQVATIGCLVLISCRVGSRFPSIELGSGVSLAFPALRVVTASGDTLTASWKREQPELWKVRIEVGSDALEGQLRVSSAGKETLLRANLTISTPGSLTLREVWSIWLAEREGFFDFSTGEPPSFWLQGDSTRPPFRLEPDSALVERAYGLTCFQPLSRVFCRFELKRHPLGTTMVRLRRQSGRATKRRYDLGLGWYFNPPHVLRSGQSLDLVIRARVDTGAEASVRWQRATSGAAP